MQRNPMPHKTFETARVHVCMHLDGHTLVQLINRISTDIDILCEQLVRHLVLLQDIVVGPRARERGSEQEAKHPAARTESVSHLSIASQTPRRGYRGSNSMGGGFTHPPLKAPTGFRAGRAVAVASWRRDDDWNVRERRGRGSGEV